MYFHSEIHLYKNQKMKNTVLLFALFLSYLVGAQNKTNMSQSIHQFSVEDISGNVFDLSSLKGKKVMVVNTASKCGLTPQYKQLQAIYEAYGSDKFVIVGFPANNFFLQFTKFGN